uniref:Uncharacterized protein n=1 Tax=Lates calcarifer TaxID=8187 RepID=A0A4W6CQM8_LATCA
MLASSKTATVSFYFFLVFPAGWFLNWRMNFSGFKRPDGCGLGRKLTSMFPPTLANNGGRGLSLSFLSPLRFGLRALAKTKLTLLRALPSVRSSKSSSPSSEATE